MKSYIDNLAMRFLLSAALLITSINCSAQEELTQYGFRIINTFPHNISSFTQGLVYHQGFIYEGTGKNGLSTLSKLNLEDAEILMSKKLSRRYFGEGIEIFDGEIFQLTWRSNMVFVYDKDSFEQTGTHYNSTEGWGLTSDGEHLILSDGTATLQFINPENFVPERKIEVILNGNAVQSLNELEFINGEIWANVWMSDFILRIDPATGNVNSIIDLTGLENETLLGSNEAVLNGIAWDSEKERLFVTGKHWANLFEIELILK